mgnify:CR=1 FL=1
MYIREKARRVPEPGQKWARTGPQGIQKGHPKLAPPRKTCPLITILSTRNVMLSATPLFSRKKKIGLSKHYNFM